MGIINAVTNEIHSIYGRPDGQFPNGTRSFVNQFNREIVNVVYSFFALFSV